MCVCVSCGIYVLVCVVYTHMNMPICTPVLILRWYRRMEDVLFYHSLQYSFETQFLSLNLKLPGSQQAPAILISLPMELQAYVWLSLAFYLGIRTWSQVLIHHPSPWTISGRSACHQELFRDGRWIQEVDGYQFRREEGWVWLMVSEVLRCQGIMAVDAHNGKGSLSHGGGQKVA